MGQLDDDLGDYDALSFDCYGTLIDWEAGIGAALVPWAEARGVGATEVELIAAFAATETIVQGETPERAYPEVLAETLRRIGGRFGVATTDDEAIRFGASVGSWPAFPDSADALARLHARYRLIVLSNVDRRSFASSEVRLGVRFDLVVTAQDVGAYKPDARSFPALLERVAEIGVSRDRLVHVAQSLYHDHEPAQAVGLPTVWIDRRAGQDGFGATPPPGAAVTPTWRFESMAAFADAATGP